MADHKLDLIIFPGLAFDRLKNRIGHGKGYYDKFMKKYIENKKHTPFTVAVTLKEQILDEKIPT